MSSETSTNQSKSAGKTNLIDTYVVGADGVASNITTHASSGQTPFGFDFNNRGILVVSEAFGVAINASAASSYIVSGNEFQLVSGLAPTTQTAAWWLVVTHKGKYAYTTNAGSDSITSYRIDKGGALTRLQAQAGYVGAGGHPTDMALSHNSQYLYTLLGGAHTISAFASSADGGLQALSGASVPVGAVGDDCRLNTDTCHYSLPSTMYYIEVNIQFMHRTCFLPIIL